MKSGKKDAQKRLQEGCRTKFIASSAVKTCVDQRRAFVTKLHHTLHPDAATFRSLLRAGSLWTIAFCRQSTALAKLVLSLQNDAISCRASLLHINTACRYVNCGERNWGSNIWLFNREKTCRVIFPAGLRVCRIAKHTQVNAKFLYISSCRDNCVIQGNETGNDTFSSPASINLKMEAGCSVETSVRTDFPNCMATRPNGPCC
jgi:hypothetical protein